MHYRRAPISAILLWLLLQTFMKVVLAIVPPGTTVTASNQTQAESFLNLTLSKGHLDETSTPLQNFISYHVPDSPTTLIFHSFGSTIPVNKLVQTMALALSVTVRSISEGRGRFPIPNGLFQYTHEFLDRNEIEIFVGDFREIGRPMSYLALFDVLRGVGEFMIMPGQKPQELEFEVEIQETGYVGTGHVDYRSVATSASGVA